MNIEERTEWCEVFGNDVLLIQGPSCVVPSDCPYYTSYMCSLNNNFDCIFIKYTLLKYISKENSIRDLE